MQKMFFSLSALLLTAVLVAGCTSDKTEESDTQKNEPSNTPTEQQQQPATEDKAVDESQETPASNETNKDNTDTSAKTEQEVKYKQKGEDKTEKATESKSVDQGYKMQQLPGFTLSPEEPGKDMLVSNENSEVFMRVETVDASQSSYADAKTSMQDHMNAVGAPVALSSEELAAFKDAKNVEGYVVDFDTEKVVGVVFEKDGLITKLTIHDNDELDLTDAMLKMASTISKK
ncbi:hypothetical protein [Lysinibacillus xylanilyticus]|uniref:hypothetical protein n=1 Tax=Lysinibacillus xylanilyticus TaxID=582475 RepID=UPI00083C9A54|nr:hypothetical protein [Lysinibacillus xylanilyticus]